MATWQLRTILYALFLFHLTSIQTNSEPDKNKREVLVVLLYPFTSCEQIITVDLQFAAAFLVAVETVNNSSSLEFSLSVGWNDTRCSELVGISAMTEQRARGVHAFIGPGNQSFCATSARVAAAWNLPMISYVSFTLISQGLEGRIIFMGGEIWVSSCPKLNPEDPNFFMAFVQPVYFVISDRRKLQ